MMLVTHKRKSLNFNLDTPEQFAIIISKYNKTFRRLTDYMSSKISDVIAANNEVHKTKLKQIIKTLLEISNKGHPPKNKLTQVFGWNECEINDYETALSNRTKKFLQTNNLDSKEYARTNSRLCIEFWLKRGYTEDAAKREICSIQSKNSKAVKHESRISCTKSNEEYWVKRGYTSLEAATEIAKFNESFKAKSKRCLEYWINAGFSIEESVEQLYQYQSSGMNARLSKYTKDEYKKQINTCIEFYTSRGFSDTDAISLISERQNTFSLKKCIEKYGKDIGMQKWEQRQEKWLKSYYDKPQEEKDIINAKKSTKINFKTLWSRELSVPGIFYIITLSGHKHKIGITSKDSIFKRYKRETLNNHKHISFGDLTISEAFMVEQIIKRKFMSTIKKNDYGCFGWTEVLESTFDELIIIANALIDNKHTLNEQFKEIKI